MDDIIDKYLSPSSAITGQPDLTKSGNDIIDKYLSPSTLDNPVSGTTDVEPSFSQNLSAGAFQGFKDVIGSGAKLFGAVDQALLPGGENRNNLFKSKLVASNKEYKNDSMAATIGRVGSQIALTAPLIPARAMQAVDAITGALPTVLSTGEKIAAPLLNRLGASVGKGAIGGGIFGAATSATNDNSIAQNVGENALGGAVGGPILDRAAALASGVVPGIKRIVGNAAINTFANKYGIQPKAAEKILTELNNEGMTIAEAEAQIKKLGPDATLADLTPALQKYAGALAQRGGRASSIVENRFDARNKTADDSARKIMINELGPKPDVVIERNNIGGTEADKIHAQASKETSADYQAAHTSNQVLDTSNAINEIDKQLFNAVGAKETALKQIRNYLFNTTKDASGNIVKIPKDSISALHEVRQGIDDIINKRGDSLPPNALRSVSKIRDLVDDSLKTNPQMQAADEKFAKFMDTKNGLKTGYEALNGGNYEQFEKTFNNAAPEVKETIKKGIHAFIGDTMEKAARGELAGAQQLLGKKSANRKKVLLALGQSGANVLDALETQAALRGTEGLVKSGSRTAINTRINNELDNQGRSSSILGDTVKGFALDATSGSLGTGTAIMAAKHTGGNILTHFREKRKDIYAEGLSDLISRSGIDLDKGFDVLNRVHKIQNAINGSKEKIKFSLPISASGIVGTPIVNDLYNRAKNKLGY